MNELNELLSTINVQDDGESLIENYQRVVSVILRLTEIHNQISSLEIWGQDWPELKKFRTLVVDVTIDKLEKVAAYESRKLTAKQMEITLER